MTQEDLVSAEQSTRVAYLLEALKSGAFFERRHAAEDLAQLPQSSEQVITALLQVAQRDRDPSVRSAAIKALETPVHARFMQSWPHHWGSTLAEIKREFHQQEVETSQGGEQNKWVNALQLLGTIVDLIGLFIRK